MRVAVTGGSGVVGAALVRHLVERGDEVRALARSRLASDLLTSLGAAPVPGDVLDQGSVRNLVEGAEHVFHVAGINEMCSADPERMWRVNVEGTRAVMTACRVEDVTRLVHTSSAVTIGEAGGALASESSPHRGFYLSEYEKTKTEAERLLFSEAGSLEVVSVNPSSVQGPGRATGTGRIVLAAARGRLPVAIDTTISVVDIDDCARGHLLAADRGRPGERYLLSGAALTMRDALDLVSGMVDHEVRPRFVPAKLLALIAGPVGAAYRLAGRQGPICREAVKVIAHGHRYDGSRATTELGLEYTPIEMTLRRTLEWFRSEGLLEPWR